MSGRVVYLSDIQPEAYELFGDVPDILDRKQAAELLGVDVKTVMREMQRGKLNHFRVGRNVRLTKQHLIDYVKGSEA